MDDTDIDNVEKYLKNCALNDLLNRLDDTVNEQCEFSLSYEQMTDIYGPRHASEPSEFRFELGDKKMIRQLVSHVKEMVDGNDKLTGLGHFELKKKKRVAKPLLSIAKPKRPNRRASSECEETIETLQSKLFKRVEEYFKKLNVDTTGLSKDMIDVEPNRVYGKVHCMLCKGDQKKKSCSKRVYYHKGTRSSFWTISNFQSHCENVHPTIATKCTVQKKKPATTSKRGVKSGVNKQVELNGSDISIAAMKPNLRKTKPKEESSAAVCDKSLEMIVIDSDADSDTPVENNNGSSYLDQFTKQMRKMVGFTLMNGDVQGQMKFQLKNDKVRYLSVVCTVPDGNCLFSALIHQLFGDPIGSKEHVNKTNKLRAAVVAHILIPDNFPLFQYNLQDHVFEIEKKKKSEISDLGEKCKGYVRDILSKPGEWGGVETIKAVSNMYKTNVAIFNENGFCYIIKSGDTNFNRTIMIAYRSIAKNGTLNHYDSVADMDPDDILASANSSST